MSRARPRPLRIRPGTRFACRGDGLCCGDVHLWGPITEREAATLSLISPDLLTRKPDDGTRVLAPSAEGRCLLYRDGCSLHAALGANAKPAVCRRFPFSITATPSGGRVVLSYRCSCAIVPSGGEITEADVLEAVAGPSGRISRDATVTTIAVEPGRAIPFSEWEVMEAELLDRLEREPPEAVLDREPFSLLTRERFCTLGEALVDGEPLSRSDHAVAWFGDALLARFASRALPPRERPWSDAFDAALEASPASSPEALLARWVGDDIWALVWARGGSLELARRVLALRVAVTRDIAARMESLGIAPARAMAEAILITTLTGISDPWAAAAAN